MLIGAGARAHSRVCKDCHQLERRCCPDIYTIRIVKERVIGTEKSPDRHDQPGLLNPLEGRINPSPPARCAERLTHRLLDTETDITRKRGARMPISIRHTNPSALNRAVVDARSVTGCKCQQIFRSLFHGRAKYTHRKRCVNNFLCRYLYDDDEKKSFCNDAAEINVTNGNAIDAITTPSVNADSGPVGREPVSATARGFAAPLVSAR